MSKNTPTIDENIIIQSLWKPVEQKPPKEDQYLVWMRVNQTSFECWRSATWYGRDWHFSVDGVTYRSAELGWTVLAWMDVPPYQHK